MFVGNILVSNQIRFLIPRTDTFRFECPRMSAAAAEKKRFRYRWQSGRKKRKFKIPICTNRKDWIREMEIEEFTLYYRRTQEI